MSDKAKQDKLIDKAIKLSEEDKDEEALKILCDLVEDDSGNFYAHSVIGDISKKRSEYEEAISAYENALEFEPDNLQLLINVGVCYMNINKNDKAYLIFNELLADYPDNFDVISNLGVVYIDFGMLDKALFLVKKALSINPDSFESLLNLGEIYGKKDKKEDALRAFFKAVKLKPDEHAVHVMIARLIIAMMRSGKVVDAVTKAIIWKNDFPDNKFVQHAAAAIISDDIPDRANDEYIKCMFDGFAKTFDRVLDVLSYKAPEIVANEVRRVFKTPSAIKCVLDAGCGTGKMGSLLRKYARWLVGVDLSEEMLKKAEETKTYDKILMQEIIQHFNNNPNSYDLITAADVFCYFGDLTDVFKGVARSLCSNGYFIFTLEHEKGWAENGFSLDCTGRYAHTKEYVTTVIEENGLKIVNSKVDCVLRKELEEPVYGMMFTIQK